MDVQHPHGRLRQPLERGQVISKAFRQSAILFVIVASLLGIWSGVNAGATIGLLVFALFTCVAAILLLYSFVNDRIDAKIAQLR
jgi:hypothetical protein